MIAHNFPRFTSDYYGKFIKDLCDGLAPYAVIEILVPADPRKESYFDLPTSIRSVYHLKCSRKPVFYRGLAHIYKNPSTWKALFSFIRQVARWNPLSSEGYDVINAHWWFPGGVAAYLLSRKLKIPYIITAHGTEISVAARKWWLKPLAKFVLSRADKVICVSDHIRQGVFEVAPEAKTEICSMPYDDEMFHLSKNRVKDISTQNVKIIAVGNLIPRKGFKYLIPAVLGVKGWNLEIYGGGSDRYRNELERMASNGDERSNIAICGRIDSKDLPEVLQNAQIFILPSITDDNGATEGLGMVILEAMACGIPVIVTDNGGTRQVVKNDFNGLVVPEKNSREIYLAIKRLAESPELCEKYRVNSIETVKNYTKRAVGDRYIEMLKC